MESDEDLRGRIAEKYGMWGAFLSTVIESSGPALDECAAYMGLTRRGPLWSPYPEPRDGVHVPPGAP